MPPLFKFSASVPDLSKGGVNLSALLLCVGGCGKLEEGGIEHFYLFKGFGE